VAFPIGRKLLRRTVTNYQAFRATPIFPVAASIFDLPCQTIVYDGGLNRQGETDYYYDNDASTTTPCSAAGTPSVTGVTNLTGHDETNYAATSTSQARGILTTMVQQCFRGINACAGNSTTTYTYDESGQCLSAADPRGNITSYSYADSYLSTNTGAYTTKAGVAPGFFPAVSEVLPR
jgi:YD repeat-containing protein